MPGCILRVASKTAQVENLVRVSGFTPTAVYKKGQPKAPGSAVMSLTSGFNVVVSIAEGLEPQVRDAVRFLTRHADAVERLQRDAAFDGMTLDFGLHDRASRDVPWPSYHLPGDLVALAGKHGVELTLSFYGPAPEPSSEQRLH
jgi:hypothetical protein